MVKKYLSWEGCHINAVARAWRTFWGWPGGGLSNLPLCPLNQRCLPPGRGVEASGEETHQHAAVPHGWVRAHFPTARVSFLLQTPASWSQVLPPDIDPDLVTVEAGVWRVNQWMGDL